MIAPQFTAKFYREETSELHPAKNLHLACFALRPCSSHPFFSLSFTTPLPVEDRCKLIFSGGEFSSSLLK
jgi:hypothetical protein